MSDSVDHPPLPKTAQRLGLRQDCNPQRGRPSAIRPQARPHYRVAEGAGKYGSCGLTRACPAIGGMFIYSGISLKVSRCRPKLSFQTKWCNRGFQFFPVDGSRQLYRVMSVATVQGLPSKWTGSLRPKSFSTVGATSTIAGFSSAILKLEKRTPGTSRGSMQWSPLQALRLSSKILVVILPMTESHEARNPSP